MRLPLEENTCLAMWFATSKITLAVVGRVAKKVLVTVSFGLHMSHAREGEVRRIVFLP